MDKETLKNVLRDASPCHGEGFFEEKLSRTITAGLLRMTHFLELS